jgi:hypothetical protein
MSDYQVTIEKLPNYTKKWVLDLNPHTYQGYTDKETSLYDGEGRIKFLNPSNPIQTYIGTFKLGEITGFGTIWYSDGLIYKGQVVSGKRHGFGSVYNSDGKFQYDGMWNNDFIDKPVYTPIHDSNGILSSQGFLVNGEPHGWFFIHTNGYVKSIIFYQNGKGIRGFRCIDQIESSSKTHRQTYKVNDSFVQTNESVHKFLFGELFQISKAGNLQEFLSKESNLKMLDALSFDYDLDTEGPKPNTSYKIFGIYGLEEITYFDSKCNLIVQALAINDTSVFVKQTNLLEPEIITKGSMWTVNIDKRNNMKLELGLDNLWRLKDFEYISKGEYIETNSGWELEGQGLIINGSKIYYGIFALGKIAQGVEKTKIDQKKLYEGYFNSSGKYHGEGTEWFSTTGSGFQKIKYQGEFSNGKYHGYGSSYYFNSQSDAIEYVGEWVSGYKHGNGTLFTVSGDEIYTGTFEYDQIV